VRVANSEMLRALRVVTVERGVDPRGYALLAFGGAGGLHAAAIAGELGIETIVCPRASGVLAALGLVVSPSRRDVQRSVFLSGEEAERRTRTAWLRGEEIEFDVLRGSPAPGTTVSGPAIVELAESTLLVPSGWSGEVDDGGTIVLKAAP